MQQSARRAAGISAAARQWSGRGLALLAWRHRYRILSSSAAVRTCERRLDARRQRRQLKAGFVLWPGPCAQEQLRPGGALARAAIRRRHAFGPSGTAAGVRDRGFENGACGACGGGRGDSAIPGEGCCVEDVSTARRPRRALLTHTHTPRPPPVAIHTRRAPVAAEHPRTARARRCVEKERDAQTCGCVCCAIGL